MNNSTTTADSPTGQQGGGRMEDDWSKIFLTFYSVLLVFTVLGNTLVCVAIYVDRRLRSPTNWFIASLSVSDLFYGLVGLPFRIANTAIRIPNVAICKVWIWADMLCVATSIANLAVISIDRYLKITKPFDYHRKMTKRRSFGAIVGVWAYAATLATFSIIAWPGAKGPMLDDHGYCTNENKVFYTVANIVAFLFPLVVLATSYTMILRAAWVQFKKMKLITVSTANKEENKKRRSVRRDFKATKTLAVVLGTFTVCWAPFFALFTIDQYNRDYWDKIPIENLGKAIFYLFYLFLPNLNSTCNPVIYAYFNVEFRRAFSKIMLFICDPQGRKYGGSYTKRRSSLTSFFQSPFTRRGSPPTPTNDGNHNHNDNVQNNHYGSKEDQQSFLNGDNMVTQM